MQKKDLITDLSKVVKKVNFEKKQTFKSFLLSENSQSKFSELKDIFNEVNLPVHKRVILKEKLILAQNIDKSRFVFDIYVKKFLSGLLAFGILFGLASNPFKVSNVAKADSPISISAVSGNVKVLRLGQELDVYPSFQLAVNDKIVTQDGFVEVVFADKSVLRVKEDSKLVIDKVVSFAGKTDSTMTLRSGGFWFNAVGGANRNSEYNFRSSELLVEVDDDSVIAMEVNDLYGQVVVFAETAEVNYKTRESFQSSVLRKGDVIKVKKEQDSISVVDSVLLAEELGQFQRIWYLDNLRKDQVYKQYLFDESLIASRKRVVVTPDSLWYPLKEAQRATRVAFTFDPVRKVEVKLQIADEKLHEAKILTNDGRVDLAERSLSQYKQTLESVMELTGKVEASQGSEASTRLKSVTRNLIESHKSDVVVSANFDSSLKDVVLNSELKIADMAGDGNNVRLRQIDSRLDQFRQARLNSNLDVNVGFEVSEGYDDQVVNLLQDFSSVISNISVGDDQALRILSEQVGDIRELKTNLNLSDGELIQDIELKLEELGLVKSNVSEESVVSVDVMQIVDDTVMKTTIQLDSLE